MSEEMSLLEKAKQRVFALHLDVSDMMSPIVYAAQRTDSVAAIQDEMDKRKIHHVPVVGEKNKVVGLVTYRDIARFTGDPKSPVSDVMQDVFKGQAFTVTKDTPLRTAAIEMLENRYGCLPIVDEEGILVGILTQKDFVKFFSEDGMP